MNWKRLNFLWKCLNLIWNDNFNDQQYSLEMGETYSCHIACQFNPCFAFLHNKCELLSYNLMMLSRVFLLLCLGWFRWVVLVFIGCFWLMVVFDGLGFGVVMNVKLVLLCVDCDFFRLYQLFSWIKFQYLWEILNFYVNIIEDNIFTNDPNSIKKYRFIFR